MVRGAVPIPVVSATDTSSAPISNRVAVISATLDGLTSGPSYGQPSATETYPRTRMFFVLASATIGLMRSRDSAIVQLVLALENDSVAAAKRETSVVVADLDSEPGESAGTPVASMILT